MHVCVCLLYDNNIQTTVYINVLEVRIYLYSQVCIYTGRHPVGLNRCHYSCMIWYDNDIQYILM